MGTQREYERQNGMSVPQEACRLKQVLRVWAALFLLTSSAPAAEIDGLSLTCWPSDAYRLVEMTFSPPGDSRTAKLYLRSEDQAEFHFVELTLDRNGVGRAIVPMAESQTSNIVYFAELVTQSYSAVRTEPRTVPVMSQERCSSQDPDAVWYTGNNPDIALGATHPGNPMAAGFRPDGISRFVGVTGQVESGGGQQASPDLGGSRRRHWGRGLRDTLRIGRHLGWKRGTARPPPGGRRPDDEHLHVDDHRGWRRSDEHHDDGDAWRQPDDDGSGADDHRPRRPHDDGVGNDDIDLRKHYDRHRQHHVSNDERHWQHHDVVHDERPHDHVSDDERDHNDIADDERPHDDVADDERPHDDVADDERPHDDVADNERSHDYVGREHDQCRNDHERRLGAAPDLQDR